MTVRRKNAKRMQARFILGSGTVERLLALLSVESCYNWFRLWWSTEAVHDCHSCILLFPWGGILVRT